MFPVPGARVFCCTLGMRALSACAGMGYRIGSGTGIGGGASYYVTQGCLRLLMVFCGLFERVRDWPRGSTSNTPVYTRRVARCSRVILV